MTTQQKPDTSRDAIEALTKRLATLLTIYHDQISDDLVGEDLLPAMKAEAADIQQAIVTLRALASPPPRWLRNVLIGDSPDDVAALLRDFDRVSARANSLAAEVERLKARSNALEETQRKIVEATSSNWRARTEKAEAELARLKAPLADGAGDALINRLVDVDDPIATEAVDTIVGQRGAIGKLKAEVARLSATLAQREEETQAARDVLAERRRHAEEGWTPEHDDKHVNGEMAMAGAAYAYGAAAFSEADLKAGFRPSSWPWHAAWWKPFGGARRMLVKAAALILAEIERLDRASPEPTPAEEPKA